MSAFKQPASLPFNRTQHSVHPTGGSLRVFRQVAWLQVGSGKVASSRPAHQRVTLTVGQLIRRDKENVMRKLYLSTLFMLFLLSSSCSNAKTTLPTSLPSIQLTKLLLTPDDVRAPEVKDWDFVYGIVDSFLKEEPADVKNMSSDLSANCPIECTKQTWKTSYRHLEISMIRAQDESKAIDKADELFKSLEPCHSEYGIDEYKWINAPTQNTHIGFSSQNKAYVLTTSTGTITFLIVSYPSPYSDDGLYEVSLMAAFANLQIDKLAKANIVP